MGELHESRKRVTNPGVSSNHICSKVTLGLQLILCQKGLARVKEIDCRPATGNDNHNAAKETEDCPVGLPMRSVVLVYVCFAVTREGPGIVMFSQPMEYVDESNVLAWGDAYNGLRELTLA
jgi:hypothetical protein